MSAAPGSVRAMPPTLAPGSDAVAPTPNLTLVTGPEALLRDRAVSAVVRATRAADSETEVHDFSALGLEPGRISGLCSPTLFGGTTVVVVRDLAEAAEAVQDEIRLVVSSLEPDVVLVLVHGGGVKGKSLLDAIRKARAVIAECKAIKWDNEKVAFVHSEFRAARRTVSPDAATALVDALGSDLRELAGACSQLVADTAGLVDRDVVERYHSGRVEASGFKVADAAVEGRYEDALRLLRQALATGVDPVPINAALASGLRSLAKVIGAPRSARPDDLARELGLAPFVVRKAKGQLATWTPNGLADAIVAVAWADEQIKGGGTDQVYALERAVTAIVTARSGQRD